MTIPSQNCQRFIEGIVLVGISVIATPFVTKNLRPDWMIQPKSPKGFLVVQRRLKAACDRSHR
jgi:hypothetical protein